MFLCICPSVFVYLFPPSPSLSPPRAPAWPRRDPVPRARAAWPRAPAWPRRGPYSTVFDSIRRYSTVFDGIRRYSTVFNGI